MDIQNKMIHALIDSVDTVSVYFEKNIETEDISGLYLYSSKKEIPYTVKYICGTRLILKVANVDVKKAYFLSNGAQEMQLIPHGVLDSVKYRYPGEDLGAVYSPRATTFKVFAPTAQKITVNIYSAAVGGTPTAYQMTEGDYGVWSVTVKENLKNFIGKTVKVLAEGFDEDELVYYGRGYFNAPDVDGKVYFFSADEVNYGEYLEIKIIKATGYDLYGERI